MKKTLLIINLLFFANSFAQKIVKEYYDYNKQKIQFEYQVDNSTGVKNGSYKAFGRKGNLAEEGFYKMNRKNGTWKQYDDYGKPFSIMNYSDDKIHGNYKQWCFEGSKTVSYLCGDYIYEMGNIVNSTQYFSNGKISKKIIPNGVCNEFFENGKKKSEWTNKDGISSPMVYFLENGKPEIETINGKTYTYCTDGYEDKGDSRYDKYGSIKSIEFDSIGFHFKYKFNERIADNYLISITKSNSEKNTREVSSVNRDGKLINVSSYENENKIKELQFQNGVLFESVIKKDNNINSIASYFPNGNKKQEYDENSNRIKIRKVEYNEQGVTILEDDLEKGFHKEFYNSGKLLLEYGLRTKKGYEGNICCYQKEYYENGKLKSEFLTKNPGYYSGEAIDTTALSDIKIDYDENGTINKVSTFKYNGDILNVANNPTDIYAVLNKRIDERFRYFTNTFQKNLNENGKFPKGEVLFDKSSKVINEISSSYNKAKSIDEKNLALNCFEKTVKKLIAFSPTEIANIEPQLKEAKKVEDIKRVLNL